VGKLRVQSSVPRMPSSSIASLESFETLFQSFAKIRQPSTSMKVFVRDSKLCRHSVDVDEGASVAHLKLLLTNMSLLPAGFVPNLVYQRRILNDADRVGSIGFNPDLSISLVCSRAAPASAAENHQFQPSRPSDANPPAAAQTAAASPAAAAGGAVSQFAAAPAVASALSDERPVKMIFSMGFDEALVQRALDQASGDEQIAIEILISGQLHPEESPSLSSSRDVSLPVIFSMGFDDAMVRRALASAGGDEERAVDLLLSGRLSPSETSSVSAPDVSAAADSVSAAAAAPSGISSSIGSTSCQQGHTCHLWTYTKRHFCDLRDDPAFTAVCLRELQLGEQGYRCDVCDYDVCLQCYSALTAAVHALTAAIGSTKSAAAAPAVNFATEWLDELGCVCPKNVDYATQCPKGHALAPFAGGGCGTSSQRVMCRICHTCAQSEQAETHWLVCSVARCCAGYAVCDGCVSALHQAPAAVAAGEGFSSQVNRAAGAAPILWLTFAATGCLAAVLALDARAVWRVAWPPDDVAV